MVYKAPSSAPNLLILFQLPWIPCSFKASSRIFPLVYTHARTLTHTYIYMHTTYTIMAPPLFCLGVFGHITLPSRPSLPHCLWTNGLWFLVFCSVHLDRKRGARAGHQQLLLLPCTGFSQDKSLAEPEALLSGCQGPGALCFRLTVLKWAP